MNIFDFAIGIERRGSEFYHHLADRTGQEELKAIFRLLALEERHLMEKFEVIKDLAATRTIGDSSALDSAHNFFDDLLASGQEPAIASVGEAFEYAMKVEAIICKLYNEAAEKEDDPDVKRLLLTIASEERREGESIRKIYELTSPPHDYISWGEFLNQGEDFTYRDPVKTSP